ncbi:Lrp/AsnC family transcriptional regulator [Candidatus Pacearchaeota archaeon]|nr:Lrp/AsnC family transcriptional regulator [Candidatus Pacearchaeota archaeon]
MKNIEPKLIELLKEGNCTPLISQIAKKLKEPSTTIHYNIKKLEKEGVIKAYKAVFNYQKIGKGFCSYVLVKLSPEEYGIPERVGLELAKFNEIESVDVITGDYEMIIKIRVKDQDEYYSLIKRIGSLKGIVKTFTHVSFKQLKTEYIQI